MPETILEEALRLTSGPRHEAYGSYETETKKIADAVNALRGTSLTPEDIPLIMIMVKLSRELNCHKRDNLCDIAGYARLWSQYLGDEDPCTTTVTGG